MNNNLNIGNNKKRAKLGKGIASLLTDFPPLEDGVTRSEYIETNTKESSSGYLFAKTDEIIINTKQPRKKFNQASLQELADSIKENGVIQPLVVELQNDRYYLISGERRLRASKIAGEKKVPIVIKMVTAKEKAIMSIVENIQREDLNCVEEANSYFDLLNNYSLTQDELSKKLGKKRSSIANFLRLLKLPKNVLSLVSEGRLSFGHAKTLVSLYEKPSFCFDLATTSIEKKLSVRELEKLIKKKLLLEEKKEFHKYAEEENEENFQKKINIGQLREDIEETTGFHCDLKLNKNGSGRVVLKFTSSEEFDSIYEYLLKNE